MIHPPNHETDFLDIVTGEFQGDTLALFIFIICFDYIIWTSTDIRKENGFKWRYHWHLLEHKSFPEF